ncbi:hypothetical protein BT69DRAFT_1275957 [Atractiella rhizophila]|nr:hypothetical protein BT69DRAFT_1275957 [Atractiella rhizophila]
MYALGLAIWSLFCEKHPFEDVDEDDVEDWIKSGNEVDLDVVPKEGGLYDFARKCWQVGTLNKTH